MLELLPVPRHLLPVDFALHKFGQSKICNFDMTLAAHQNICSLDIAMENVGRCMQVIESLEYLTDQVFHHGSFKSHFGTIDDAMHVKLVIVEDEIARVPFKEDLSNPYNVFVLMTDGLEQLDLA